MEMPVDTAASLLAIASRFSSSDGLLDQMNGDDVQLAFKTQDLMTKHVAY